MLPQHAPVRRGLTSAALVWLLCSAARGAELADGVEVTLVAPEALLASVRGHGALAQVPVAVVPSAATLRRAAARPLKPVRSGAPPVGFARLRLRAPLPAKSAALRSLLHATAPGQPACALVVDAREGLGPALLDELDRVGPCLLELHVAAPGPFAERLSGRRETSVVVHPNGALPGPRGLAALSLLPRPFVSAADAAGEAPMLVERLRSFGTGAPGLELRAPRGKLSDRTFMALRAPRDWPLRVVAEGGLDPDAARDLRTLGHLEVRVSLESASLLPSELAAAVELLRRPVEPVPRAAPEPTLPLPPPVDIPDK